MKRIEVKLGEGKICQRLQPMTNEDNTKDAVAIIFEEILGTPIFGESKEIVNTGDEIARLIFDVDLITQLANIIIKIEEGQENFLFQDEDEEIFIYLPQEPQISRDATQQIFETCLMELIKIKYNYVDKEK